MTEAKRRRRQRISQLKVLVRNSSEKDIEEIRKELSLPGVLFYGTKDKLTKEEIEEILKEHKHGKR